MYTWPTLSSRTKYEGHGPLLCHKITYKLHGHATHNWGDTDITCEKTGNLRTLPSHFNMVIFLKIQKNNLLTHWGRVTHIRFSKLTSVGSDNGLLPGRRQAIIWTNAGILLIGPLGINFSENLIEIHIFSFKKMHLKMSSGKWRPFCLGLNVLRHAMWCLSWVQHMIKVIP